MILRRWFFFDMHNYWCNEILFSRIFSDSIFLLGWVRIFFTTIYAGNQMDHHLFGFSSMLIWFTQITSRSWIDSWWMRMENALLIGLDRLQFLDLERSGYSSGKSGRSISFVLFLLVFFLIGDKMVGSFLVSNLIDSNQIFQSPMICSMVGSPINLQNQESPVTMTITIHGFLLFIGSKHRQS